MVETEEEGERRQDRDGGDGDWRLPGSARQSPAGEALKQEEPSGGCQEVSAGKDVVVRGRPGFWPRDRQDPQGGGANEVSHRCISLANFSTL